MPFLLRENANIQTSSAEVTREQTHTHTHAETNSSRVEFIQISIWHTIRQCSAITRRCGDVCVLVDCIRCACWTIGFEFTYNHPHASLYVSMFHYYNMQKQRLKHAVKSFCWRDYEIGILGVRCVFKHLVSFDIYLFPFLFCFSSAHVSYARAHTRPRSEIMQCSTVSLVLSCSFVCSNCIQFNMEFPLSDNFDIFSSIAFTLFPLSQFNSHCFSFRVKTVLQSHHCRHQFSNFFLVFASLSCSTPVY